jgi:hypothetical protein
VCAPELLSVLTWSRLCAICAQLSDDFMGASSLLLPRALEWHSPTPVLCGHDRVIELGLPLSSRSSEVPSTGTSFDVAGRCGTEQADAVSGWACR